MRCKRCGINCDGTVNVTVQMGGSCYCLTCATALDMIPGRVRQYPMPMDTTSMIEAMRDITASIGAIIPQVEDETVGNALAYARSLVLQADEQIFLAQTALTQ